MKIPVKVSRQIEFFTSDNDNFAALQQILCYNRCKSSDQMATAIDDNRLFANKKVHNINFYLEKN